MDIFGILTKIYTSKTPTWINDLEDNEIQPVLIQKWLSMNANIAKYVGMLDTYTFYINPKMYLGLAWAIIPKVDKMPYCKYLKYKAEEDKLQPLIKKIRSHLQLSDNDWKYSRDRIMSEINSDKGKWFRFFGMEKKFWKQNGMDFKEMKVGEVRKGKEGLDIFGF